MAKKTPHHTLNRKFAPAPGEDFDIKPADPEVLKIRAEMHRETARTRNFLARVVVVTILSGTILATGLSLYEENFQYLATTWAAAGTALTLVLTFYFKKERSSG